MNIIVATKLVPDLVEELKLNESNTALDPDWLRLKLNEFDDHAIEQAILLKERGGDQVVVIAIDGEGADDVLYSAAARGADRLIKITLETDLPLNNHALARCLAPIIKELQAGLVLTGVQAHNDLDGALGPLLAGCLEIPYIGYVSSVSVHTGIVVVKKEFSGGLAAEIEAPMPAVLGIQAAESPPRYVAFSRIRQMMKSVTIEERPVIVVEDSGGPHILRMQIPESAERAQILDGSPEMVAENLVEIFTSLGVL